MNTPLKPLSAWIAGVGLIAPGLPDWPSARFPLDSAHADSRRFSIRA